jgi:pimeloyl-ACP methyl ester carboxylesterase
MPQREDAQSPVGSGTQRRGAENANGLPQAAAHTSHFIQLEQVKLHYLDFGTDGNPPMLFLHGGAVNAHWFDFVATGCTADYHVIALDQRGHGDSSWAEPPDYRYGRYAADIAEVLEKLDLHDLILVGHSMGGLVSLVYAANYPGRVKQLVIVDSTLRATPERVAVLHEVGGRAGSSYETHAEFLSRFRLRPEGTTARPEIIRYLAERGGRQFPDGRWRHKFDRNVYAKREFLDIMPHWDRIKMPALLVKGALSNRITSDIYEEIRSRCLHVELVEVEGSDHHVTLDNPGQFVQVVSAFLKRTGAHVPRAQT